MVALFLMVFGMTAMTKCYDIGAREHQPTHVFLSLAALYFYQMMHFPRGDDEVLGLAPLAQRMLTQHLRSQLSPLTRLDESVVQCSVSRHILPSYGFWRQRALVVASLTFPFLCFIVGYVAFYLAKDDLLLLVNIIR